MACPARAPRRSVSLPTALKLPQWRVARKRARAVARAWPGLVNSLGPTFCARFAAFAACAPLPAQGGALADGRAFAAALASEGLLPDAGRFEMLHVDLHHRQTRTGLRPRRGLAVRFARLRTRRRVCIGLRLPWLVRRA